MTSLRLSFLLLLIGIATLPVAVSGGPPIKEYLGTFEFSKKYQGVMKPHYIHSTGSWTTRTMGRCAHRCKTPTRMGGDAYKNKFIVSWVASFERGGAYLEEEDQYGHLSTFSFTESGGFKKLNDFWYKECNKDMGEVAWSKDGQIIGAICITKEDVIIPGAIQQSQPSNNTEEYRRKRAYLFEWTGGKITQKPDTVVFIQGNIGGAKYGHWSLSLNNDGTKYYVKNKVSTWNGGHESAVSYFIDRQNGYAKVRDQYDDSCGSGHTISNRVTHNRRRDTFAVYCGLDSGLKTTMRVFPQKSGKNTELLKFVDRGPVDYPAGGNSMLISAGRKGWMASALGPEDIYANAPDYNSKKIKLQDQKVGIAALPAFPAESTQDLKKKWRWFKPCPPLPTIRGQTNNPQRAGLVQLANWGRKGENSGVYLLGYTPAMKFQGDAREFRVVEINRAGKFLHQPVLLQQGGWGEDTPGIHLPGSGCVVFPFAWTGNNGPGEPYPSWKWTTVIARSKYMRLTALCPDASVPRMTPFKGGTQCPNRRALEVEANSTLGSLYEPYFDEELAMQEYLEMDQYLETADEDEMDDDGEDDEMEEEEDELDEADEMEEEEDLADEDEDEFVASTATPTVTFASKLLFVAGAMMFAFY